MPSFFYISRLFIISSYRLRFYSSTFSCSRSTANCFS